jgi:hypothetical protein
MPGLGVGGRGSPRVTVRSSPVRPPRGPVCSYGGQVQAPAPALADPPILGNLSITYDPITGGAYINGVLRRPGDPIFNDPRVKKGVADSKAGMKDDSSSQKSKDPFVGDYGDGRETGDTGNTPGFAEGGLVGSSPIAARLREVVSHFAEGGRVHFAQGGAADRVSFADRLSAMGLGTIDMPHLAIGGMPDFPVDPSTGRLQRRQRWCAAPYR